LSRRSPGRDIAASELGVLLLKVDASGNGEDEGKGGGGEVEGESVEVARRGLVEVGSPAEGKRSADRTGRGRRRRRARQTLGVLQDALIKAMQVARLTDG